ncbi:hypothetical protein PUN28_015505 [Cardiocondyla obscurior]|uniref:Uncharacterized protein n=1 Tax=Cardiocondyla obscurior TaxID=286306 RepID=A0AAW2EWN4_9HYME
MIDEAPPVNRGNFYVFLCPLNAYTICRYGLSINSSLTTKYHRSRGCGLRNLCEIPRSRRSVCFSAVT